MNKYLQNNKHTVDRQIIGYWKIFETQILQFYKIARKQENKLGIKMSSKDDNVII